MGRQGRQADWGEGAAALVEASDWRGMVDWCREWTQSHPEDAKAWYSLGFAYASLDCNQDAVEAFNTSLRIDLDDVGFWHNLVGITYFLLDCYPDAIEAFSEAIRINPEDPITWYCLGLTYGRLDHYPDAIEAFSEAIRINPGNVDAWYGLGVAYQRSGNRTAALGAVQELRRLDQRRAEELFNIIETH